MDITILEKDSLPVLLDKFEKCAHAMNYNRAVAFKIVHTIDTNNLLLSSDNYSEYLLAFFKKEHNIEDPWNYSTKDLLESLYPFFSWYQYTRYGLLVSKIDFDLATRMSEDALVSLNKERLNLHTLIPYLKGLGKDIITIKEVIAAKEANLKKIKKEKRINMQELKITIPKEIQDKAKINILTKTYRKTYDAAKQLTRRVSDLEKLLKTVTEERNEYLREVRILRNELSRFQKR